MRSGFARSALNSPPCQIRGGGARRRPHPCVDVPRAGRQAPARLSTRADKNSGLTHTNRSPINPVHFTTASLVVRGTPTSSPFTATHPIPCASLRAMDISRAATPARRGARQAAVSRSATCAAWRSIRGNRTSSWYRRRPDRTLRTWPADRMVGCIADSFPSAGSPSATVGQSHPAQSRRCSALARNRERCGPPMSAACTVRTTVERAGDASPATTRRRSISAVSPCCSSADKTRYRRPECVGLSSRRSRPGCREARPTARTAR